MQAGLDPFTFLIISMAGWMNQRQQQVIEYLVEENRVLREQIGNRRMRFQEGSFESTCINRSFLMVSIGRLRPLSCSSPIGVGHS